MSWLLFLDESGHDGRNAPYEVRGGVAIHTGKLWSFVQSWNRLEISCFGSRLTEYKKEIKGCKLLDKDRFKWAAQADLMSDEARCKHCRGFLNSGFERKPPHRDEFTAYGQACLEMTRGIFEILRSHEVKLFASVVPRKICKPFVEHEYLRKDHVFLLERFFYFLEEKQEHGLLVMDEVEKLEDRRFVRRLHNYFTKTLNGRYRTQWIIPAPFFVASDMSELVQAADVCIYCINWGFRLPHLGMNAPTRLEIASEFGPWLNLLQFNGEGYRNGQEFKSYGITFVSNPQ